jgi:hypothetical protein
MILGDFFTVRGSEVILGAPAIVQEATQDAKEAASRHAAEASEREDAWAFFRGNKRPKHLIRFGVRRVPHMIRTGLRTVGTAKQYLLD